MSRIIMCVCVKNAYIILAQGHLKQSNICRGILFKQFGIFNIILKKVKGLRESKEKNDVNHAKRKHISSNHAEDHRNEWPG